MQHVSPKTDHLQAKRVDPKIKAGLLSRVAICLALTTIYSVALCGVIVFILLRAISRFDHRICKIIQSINSLGLREMVLPKLFENRRAFGRLFTK
jgi:hypothetical protein